MEAVSADAVAALAQERGDTLCRSDIRRCSEPGAVRVIRIDHPGEVSARPV